ncbi:MAG: tyrosine-type recombinase/integrase [Bdellovibrionaceae bacterium]|nr:tyrosine-type recombinase/integrase [Pseudobdellovibrionaceae bacterium]
MSRVPRYALNKNKYLLDDELARLRQIFRSFQDSDPRNVLLLELALQTGARATELLNCQRSDLILNDETLFIRGIKGSNDREIPLPSKLFQRLHRYNQGLEGTKLFDISYERLYQIWQLYRPVPKKFHSLRHTFAIELYKRTRDIRLLQVALGHRNIANTMIYADYLYSKEELRRLLVEI